jgi:hypothetical protein
MFCRVAFPLAPFGAIASLSSERNAVSKSSALNDESFSIAVRIDAKEQSALGKMLAIRKTSPLRVTVPR